MAHRAYYAEGAVWTWRSRACRAGEVHRAYRDGPSGLGEQSVSCLRGGRLDVAHRAYRAGGAVWTWRAERIVLEGPSGRGAQSVLC